MSEWKECRLGDVISIKSGLPYKGEYLNKGDNYLLGMGCVSFTETFLPHGARRYNDEGKPQYVGKAGDIVLATRQQSDNMPILGMPAIIPDIFSEGKVIVGSNLYIVDNKSDIDNRFLFWLLRTPQYINHIRYSQTGTTVRMITKKDIENFTFYCPPKNLRNAISSLLWNIQEKIETNRKINARLEELAQALFKSWFIDFEPFGGKMPEDWGTGKLSDIANIIMGQSPKGDCINSNQHGMIFYQGKTEFGDRFPAVKNFTSDITRVAPANSVLLSVRAPVGDVNITLNECCIGRGIASIDYKYGPNSFIFLLLKNKTDYFDIFDKGGTVFGCINKRALEGMPIFLPSTSIIDSFNDLLGPIDMEFERRDRESSRLAALRDTLLPKLMSGELIPE